jgi:hypothetical protein
MNVGDPVMYRGERMLVKRVGETIVIVEDDEGASIAVDQDKVQPIGYTAIVDSDGWVRSLEDTDA